MVPQRVTTSMKQEQEHDEPQRRTFAGPLGQEHPRSGHSLGKSMSMMVHTSSGR